MLAARRWGVPTALGIVVVVSVVMLGYSGVSVMSPLGRTALPVWVYLPATVAIVACSVVARPPHAYELQAPGFGRAHRLGLAVAALAVALVGPAILWTGVGSMLLVTWTLGMVALGTAGAFVAPRFYWVPPFVVGVALIGRASSGGGESVLAASTGPAALATAGLAWVAAALLFAWPRPRLREQLGS